MSEKVIIEDVRWHLVRPGVEGVYTKVPLEHVFVEVISSDGAIGIGECSCWLSAPANSLIAGVLEGVRELVIGRDAFDTERLWSDLFRRFSFVGNRGLVTTAISGLDIALWDLKGKVLGLPIYALLGGAVRDAVPMYGHAMGVTDEDAAESGRRAVADGYEAVKHNPFSVGVDAIREVRDGHITRPGLAAVARRTAAVREAIGPDIELMIDMHGRFHPAAALAVIRELEPLGITWFEEPVAPEATAALERVRAQTDAPLCVGERLFTRWDFLPVLEKRLVDYVMPDVSWTGGITELKKLAALAEAYRTPIAPHAAEGPIQLVAGAHVMLTTPNFYRQEHVTRWLEQKNMCLIEPLPISDGTLFLSDAPGLGIELDMEFVAAHDSRRVEVGA
jgi:galactonate dehydratase